jgi:hypothetical protein
MRRLLIAALALGTSALVVPSAHASSPDYIWGGCTYNTDYQSNDGHTFVGRVGTVSVTTTGDGVQVPIGATVTCWIEVNGVVAPGTTHSFGDLPGVTGVQIGAVPTSFTVPDEFATIGICQSVTFADSTTQSVCYVPNLQFPEQRYIDLLNQIFDVVDGIQRTTLDPVLCPVLRQLAGSYPGGVTISPDGDVSLPDPLLLGLDPIYDCPPV